MCEQNKVGRYSFMAEPFRVDFSGKLPVAVLGNQLLNASDFHSNARGFGIPFLHANNCTWVLSRLALDMTDMPHRYEHFEIETWVEDVYRLFTDRNYRVLNEKGEPIAYARSIWAMIDLTTRKPLDLLALHKGDILNYIVKDKECPISRPSRIQLKEGTCAKEYTALYSDIDINGHFNSIKYMEHILNLFSLEKYRQQSISRFEIAYVAESYYGDHLSFLLDEPKKDEFNIEILKNETEIVCRSKVIFR